MLCRSLLGRAGCEAAELHHDRSDVFGLARDQSTVRILRIKDAAEIWVRRRGWVASNFE